MLKENKKILIFIDWYLPGYKAGGQIPSVAAIVNLLHQDAECFIVTSDRDEGDLLPYSNMQFNKWIKIQHTKIIYLSPEKQNFVRYKKIISEINPATVYFNSFFSFRFTILPLLCSKIYFSKKQIILAPRGMLGQGALELKSRKKKLFITLAKTIGLYKNITWQASSELEKKEIEKIFGKDNQISVAADLSTLSFKTDYKKRKKQADEIKLIFLSRLTPKKNLDYALNVLKKVNSKITFDIVGPIDDTLYWIKCQALIKQMPSTIKVQYLGTVLPDEVSNLLSEYHFLFLPTKNENYGHVIAESLINGVPVLISDQTPWQDIEQNNAGQVMALNDFDKFVRTIENAVKLNNTAYQKLSESTFVYAQKKLQNKKAFLANQKLFLPNNYCVRE